MPPDPNRGRVIGRLAEGEDRDALEAALKNAPQMVEAGEVEVLYHHPPQMTEEERAAHRVRRLERLRHGKLKRFVFQIDTAAGPRIVKIASVVSWGNVFEGLFSSKARVEQRNHLRAQQMGLAATPPAGYLEWRSGPWLYRAAQVQLPLAPDRPSLDDMLPRELAQHGEAALAPLARALAEVHDQRFFHADVKGFHAFPCDIRRDGEGPATYSLQWLDLGRVSFWMSRRKRIINLYQVYRFILPDRDDWQRIFTEHYCRHAGWYADAPARAFAIVRRFLTHKMKTYQNPYA